MKTRAIALIITATLVFAVFPGVANAAATGHAHITSAAAVNPGPRDFSIQVTSENAPVNYVNIILPSDDAGISIDPAATINAPPGWTGQAMAVGFTEQITFTGGMLPAGAPLTFTFPTSVRRPVNADRSGPFIVELSSNGGVASRAAMVSQDCGFSSLSCTLTARVAILQVETTAPAAPAGVVDGTGTEHQEIVVETNVRNYALSPVSVTPTLRASAPLGTQSDEQIRPAGSQLVEPLALATFRHGVTLGTARTYGASGQGVPGDRGVSFVGGARVDSGGEAVANALTSSKSFVVERAPQIFLPSRSAVAPRVVRPGQAVTVTAPVEKDYTPGLTVSSGSLSFSSTTCPLAAPVTFGGGTVANNLLFNCAVESAAGEATHDANLVLHGVDANGATFTADKAPWYDDDDLPLRMTIDGLAPIVKLSLLPPLDGDGNPQTAVKKGDTLRVLGEIDDDRVTIDSVRISDGAGNSIPVTVTPVKANVQGSNRMTRFTGAVIIPFELAAAKLTAVARATDNAGNQGAGVATVQLDNVKPRITFAQTLSTTDLQALRDEQEAEPTAVRVDFTEAGRVKGGCNPEQWRVDGAQAVAAVVYPSGLPCQKNGADPDGSNGRVLLLTVPMERSDRPTITYKPTPLDRASDGAGNTADQRTIRALAGITPAAPELISMFRATGTAATGADCAPAEGRCEEAYYDTKDETYHTRFSGTDLLATVSRAAPGYRLEVLDATGLVLTSTSVSANTASIRIPLPSTDGEYVRQLRFVNNNLIGKVLDLRIVVDRRAPALAPLATVTDAKAAQRVTVSFSEPVVGGINASQNWKFFDRTSSGATRAYSPDFVDQDYDPVYRRSEPMSRHLTGTTGQYGTFAGVGYLFNPAVTGNARHTDRAGNLLPDNGGPTALVAP